LVVSTCSATAGPVEVDVAAYPGRRPARLALAAATGTPSPLTELASPDGTAAADGWREALSALAPTLAADPWADRVALVVRQVTVLPTADDAGQEAEAHRGARTRRTRSGDQTGGGGARWLLRDRAGQALPLAAGVGERWGWSLLAVSGGLPLDIAAEWDGFELTPLAAMPSRPLPVSGSAATADSARAADVGRRRPAWLAPRGRGSRRAGVRHPPGFRRRPAGRRPSPTQRQLRLDLRRDLDRSPAFACTPDRFPDLLATALRREEVGRWAALHGLVPA